MPPSEWERTWESCGVEERSDAWGQLWREATEEADQAPPSKEIGGEALGEMQAWPEEQG